MKTDIFSRTAGRLAAMSWAKRRPWRAAVGADHVVGTHGCEPTLLLSAEGGPPAPTLPVRPVDTVSASDTFASVLAGGLAAREGWESTLRRANVEVAFSVLAVGAQTWILIRAQVDGAMKAGRRD